MLDRLREGLRWRWHLATRIRYLRRKFRNGDSLARSYRERTACDEAIGRDGVVVRHPPGRTGLAGMILEVWYDEIYTGRFYRPAPGDVVVDAGANVGLFSIQVARRQPGCTVFAFEPFQENYRLLLENLASAGASNVRPFPFALSGHSGVSAMIEGGQRSQDHQLGTAAPADPSLPSVRTCSLDEVLAITGSETIQLFKCDIEGSEQDLFGAADSDTLKRCRRYAIEYHDNLRPGTLELLMRRLGPTHDLEVRPAGADGYGMLYATAKTA